MNPVIRVLFGIVNLVNWLSVSIGRLLFESVISVVKFLVGLLLLIGVISLVYVLITI